MLLAGCEQKYRSNAYGYKYMQTTGITQYIVMADGEEIPIQFSSSSDKEAIDTLSGLKWNVLIPNANGTNITLTGVLDKKSNYTPEGTSRAKSGKYQEFELHSWSIVVPFRRQYWKNDVEGPDGTLLLEQKMHLDANDFTKKVSGNLTVFEKTAHNE